MQCAQCQHQNRDGARFCDACGARLAAPCPACGHENRPAARFCNECGAALTTAAAAPSPPTVQPASQMDQQAPAAPPPTSSFTPDAERRQLTVMFCDLADSTSLSRQLDPEDLREVVRAYQETAAAVIQRYEGHIAQYLGDGLLVYFGWPRAHEDDAQRAVHAGLGIIKAMQALNTRLEQAQGVRLAVRLGIHVGPVVIGEMGSGARHEQLALGETPNIAARLEGMAQPNTVVISDTTLRLVEGYFTCTDLGLHTLRGLTTPMQVYGVQDRSGAHTRMDAVAHRGLTPLVGREQEVGLLLERWSQVQDGLGQVVLLSGEAGLGKSRLVQVLQDQVGHEPYTRLACRSSPYYQNTALYPLTDLWQRTLQWHPNDTPETKVTKLEHTLSQYRLPLADTMPLMTALLSLPLPETRYAALQMTPQRQRQKTLEALRTMVFELAERQPVLLIVEDLHWTDPSTLEWLGMLIEQAPTAALMLLLTCRPEFVSPWGRRSHLTPLALHRLSRVQIEVMVQRLSGGKTIPAEVMQHLVEKTDGVPLYIEEMTRAILEAGVLRETADRYELMGPLTSLAIPATLQDSLMARLDRLGPAKGVAQLGATIGRQFSYSLLQAVSSLDELVIWRSLVELVEAELLYQRGSLPDATFTFKHALIQETAYQSLLKSTRQQYHTRIAQTLAERFPETVATQPELLAQHYTEAGLTDQAIGYWQRAGQRALQRSANLEAISHLTRGLEGLKTLPTTPERLQYELDIQTTLGPALMATKGYVAPEVGHAYARARELCQQLGDTPQLFPVLRGLWRFYQARGEARTAYELAAQCLSLAQRAQDSALLLEAHEALGVSLYQLGEMLSARTHFEHGVALYDPQQHRSLAFLYGHDPGVVCLTRAAVAQWVLGYPDQALHQSHAALAMARELSHPFSLAYTLCWTVFVPQFRRDGRTVQEWAEALVTLATEQGFAQQTLWGTILRGWALAAQGQGEAGIAQMRQGLTAWQAMGAKTGVPYCLTLLAEACGAHGQAAEGLRLLAEALAVVHDTGERFHEAECYRVQGELLLMPVTPDEQQAEACFQQALAVAHRQQAKSWELRAAMSLARLWQRQGKHQDAYDLLAPVYHWFTEGFDTADLQEAKVLLETLAEDYGA